MQVQKSFKFVCPEKPKLKKRQKSNWLFLNCSVFWRHRPGQRRPRPPPPAPAAASAPPPPPPAAPAAGRVGAEGGQPVAADGHAAQQRADGRLVADRLGPTGLRRICACASAREIFAPWSRAVLHPRVQISQQPKKEILIRDTKAWTCVWIGREKKTTTTEIYDARRARTSFDRGLHAPPPSPVPPLSHTLHFSIIILLFLCINSCDRLKLKYSVY